MKKIILPFIFIVLMIASCENPSTQNVIMKPTETFGSLTIGEENTSRKLQIEKILGAKVSVSGEKFAPLSTETTIKDGKVTGVTIQHIPTGKNRIITVQAAKKSSGITDEDFIDGVVMRAVTDINTGNNSVDVNWASTALGNVFYELLQLSYDISSINAENKEALAEHIDSTVHATLINTKALADDFSKNMFMEKKN